MLEHGGRLGEAAARWGIPRADWLDLSTGIAPWPYPVPAVPAEVWQRLPEDEDGLEAAARDYYGAGHLLALPGSQSGIQLLPRLLAPGRVALPAPIYAEHPAAWRAAGHQIVAWDAGTTMRADYAVLCNPNNPTGQRFTRAELLERARALRLLVVDEAFIDAAPEESLADHATDNIVVLRSLGKFFGLAGARVGFAIAAPELLTRLAVALGPWAVGHPARWAARHALADRAWPAGQRERLRGAAARLDALLSQAGFAATTGTAFFRYLPTPRAAALHAALARRGILVRRFDDPGALRFGLPGSENAWQRLTDTLKEFA
ncbi:MAG: threonine-phosphate decarboxylase CobD [Gammaproteobacteria bacterium]|nr:threonine-phosphate decarboxylase [Rhodocyclaceae bacterium]MBU3909304.1 threonine-phosphate decarboxylase CobD [Gammaproteobacteria bacterium]MBU3989705.1 threonine-phosphate decarboxylase CobD [Gammaproteobacteria bacterium]MBU4005536.1 threonine-phosphate decarboxylase CobD [Gammaproteobacteria bacterium]MBU4020911.1 threonine-phosphate decarboxylase CobD [Gammaproteobacteria bacterium]